MSKNTGIPYEILTQQIFQALHDQDQVKNIKVQHNVELQGKTLKHQIDVYWEYELGGIVYRAIVQAKDWATQPVTQNQLLAFKAILDDLPGQPRGIFVTRTGYQSGAEEFAKANGILLYELREPTTEDMEGKVMTIKLKIHAFAPQSSNVQPIFDQTWVVEEGQKLGLGPSENLQISAGGFENQLCLMDESGQKVGTFHDVLKTMLPPKYVGMSPTVKEHLFSSPTFMLTGNARFPRIKLLGIRATISNECLDQEMILKGEDLIGFIMRDVIADKMRLLDKQNRPIKKTRGDTDK